MKKKMRKLKNIKKNFEKNYIKKDNGITIISQVITIIILLILTGVTLFISIGPNGIVKQAQNAKNAIDQTSEKQKIIIAMSTLKINKEKIEIDDIYHKFDETGISYENTNEFPVTTTMDNSKWLVTKNGNIIDGELVKYTSDGLKVCLDGNYNTYDGNSVTTSTWYDLSGNENNATLKNFKFDSTSGWIENGLKTQGNTKNNIKSKEEVIIPYKIEKNSSFSIEMVFQKNGNEKVIYLKSDNDWHTFVFHDWYNDKGIYDGRFYIGGNIYVNSNNRFAPENTKYYLLKNKPQYIAYTFNANSNTATLYINGTKNVYSKKYKGQTDACNFFKIKTLDENNVISDSVTYHQLRFYNRELSKNEIEKNFQIDNEKYKIN